MNKKWFFLGIVVGSLLGNLTGTFIKSALAYDQEYFQCEVTEEKLLRCEYVFPRTRIKLLGMRY